MERVAFAQVTAAWNPAAPDIEPPDFARQVWPGFRTGAFAINSVIVRHDTKADKAHWRSFSSLLDLRNEWSAVAWTDQLPDAFCKRIYESTSGHLSVFFRQSIEGAARLRALWREWPVEVSDDLVGVQLAAKDEAVVRALVTSAADGQLLLSFWGERETALWLGEPQLLRRLEQLGANP